MKMNLPIDLKGKRLLVAGIGGGFDILGAIPFLQECQVALLANLNTQARGFTVKAASADSLVDSPEFLIQQITRKPVCVFAKEGVQSVRKGYQEILDHYAIDAILLVDGGVDSLMRGDEEEPGTLLEDFVSLTAVSKLAVKEKYLACLGFGTEVEEQVCHFRALENIAGLAASGAFLGSCSLTAQTDAFGLYQRVARQVFATKDMRKSHIHSRVIPAIEGDFGVKYIDADAALPGHAAQEAFINPLMGIYWFFDVEGVVKRNLLAAHLEPTGTWTDVMMVYRQWKNSLTGLRESVKIPL